MTDSRADLRRLERRKYNREYFERHYWAEDLPGTEGNRGISYNDPTHTRRFSYLSQLLVESLEFDTLLDAGCGTGLLTLYLRGFGKRAVGLDVSCVAGAIHRTLATTHSRPPHFIRGTLETLPFPARSFDSVWCSDVLEHIPFFDVEASAAELLRVAKKNLVLTINLDNPYEYHPTILSRATWESIFLGLGGLRQRLDLEAPLASSLTQEHPEYDLFVFERI